jgi:thiamine-phosphate pyrophosphorylase
MNKLAVDYTLYLITDRVLVGEKDFFQSVRRALEGGVTLLQVREKEASSKEFYETALRLKKLAAEFRVPLIINDRIDVALAIDADGVHIGQEDLPLDVVRQLVGPDKIVGYSASTPEEAIYGEKMGADYLGVGAVYPTGSKKDAGVAIGITGLQRVVESVSLPVVGIGGIGTANVKAVKKTGAAGVAVISAVLSQPDTYQAAKELVDLWRL